MKFEGLAGGNSQGGQGSSRAAWAGSSRIGTLSPAGSAQVCKRGCISTCASDTMQSAMALYGTALPCRIAKQQSLSGRPALQRAGRQPLSVRAQNDEKAQVPLRLAAQKGSAYLTRSLKSGYFSAIWTRTEGTTGLINTRLQLA